MALTSDERISISKKLVGIPKQNAAADDTIAILEAQKQKAIDEDNANKSLMDNSTVYVNLYQGEINRYDGNVRNSLLEQDVIDASSKKLQNFFFPNDLSVTVPSIPGNIWTNFSAFSGSKAIGKKYDESYDTARAEEQIITDINAKIATIEGFSAVIRSTGQECNTGGSCSNPIYLDAVSCALNGGIWTPMDVISAHAAMQTAATDLTTLVQEWETYILATYPIVPTALQDTDPTRTTENNASRADITNAVSVIDTWQTYPNFDTGHGQTTCAGFNAIDVSTLAATKFRATELQPLKDEITARSSFITTRKGQINGHLGGINQNFTNGTINSTTGFYGTRFRFIEARLNLMTGTLNKVLSIGKGQDAQDRFKESNDNVNAAYATVMLATLFRAPSVGTATIHVINGAGFSNGNSVYIVADNQPELALTIVNVVGNTIYLSAPISQRYRQDIFARMYKML